MKRSWWRWVQTPGKEKNWLVFLVSEISGLSIWWWSPAVTPSRNIALPRSGRRKGVSRGWTSRRVAVSTHWDEFRARNETHENQPMRGSSIHSSVDGSDCLSVIHVGNQTTTKSMGRIKPKVCSSRAKLDRNFRTRRTKYGLFFRVSQLIKRFLFSIASKRALPSRPVQVLQPRAMG